MIKVNSILEDLSIGKITLDDALAKLKAGKGSRDINKVVMASIASAAKQGDAASKKYLQRCRIK